MALRKTKQKASSPQKPALAVGGGSPAHPFGALWAYTPPPAVQGDLFCALREAIPIVDTAIYKLIRLTGGFQVVCTDARFQGVLDDFLAHVPSDSAGRSLQSFLDNFFEQLLTYGTAVAEMLPDETGAIQYLYNAPHKSYLLRRGKTDFRVPEVLLNDGLSGKPVPYQENFLTATLHPRPGAVYGTSLLEGLPFVSSILLKIYNAIGQNWERVGNVRFAVTYKPSDDAHAYTRERAMQIASEWGDAMRSREIGADNQILDSEVPVRQMLEQIVAKLSLPPFLLGLSWSTTERMASQQADILTTELEQYRRILTPVIDAVCRKHLRAFGCTAPLEILWDDITLKDTVDEATARHLDAQTKEILQSLGETKEEN